MKFQIHFMLLSCLIGSSVFGMQRIVKPVAARVASSVSVRNCASKNNSEKENVFNDVKETLGTKSDFFCCAYLGTLGYIFYCWMLPRSACRHDRHPRLK